MPELTKAEYEASECLGKRHSIIFPGNKDFFYLCPNCHPHRSNSNGPCEHKLRGRCKKDPDGPSADEILDLFLKEGEGLDSKNDLSSDEKKSRSNTIRLFCSHFGRSWDCSGCKYWELPWGAESSITRTAYSTTHGAKTLIDEVTMFCTYFIVRKCMMDQEERKSAVRCMIELVSFLVAKGYVTDTEYAERIISTIRPGLTLEPDTIQQKLCELWANDYWRKLMEEGAGSKRAKTDNNSDFPYVGKTSEPELPWNVEKITSEGWLLSNYDAPTVVVTLPNDVRKLGMENMQISCMKLVHIGNGIWEPSG
eukprot:CAMPEP_0197458896 /NCGR_PEP_ID=MMETSP1175-20131217/49936_1 /TAXON_ID=1003142 /ORGANISM="Triceratium dubium, Strain CCMP147" /LENGTH=308 /DNA_ID=CAMNT_0042993633 /DNA_START=24 /DNA_END=947 /DNA_ORIENTATION=-